MRFTNAIAVSAAIAAAEAQYQGFNYGSTFTNGAAKQQADFEAEFTRAQTLQGASCFSSARLYTNIQAGTSNTPISAIPAAISTKTTLLLGLWASAGQDVFTNEIQALQSSIQQYGSDLTDLIVGISVGSEDLYRISPTGIENMSGVGADPDTLVSYIQQVRAALQGTSGSSIPIGHVDTWTAWVNASNNAVIDNVDWIGMDAYPYFQTTMANSIENGNSTFFDAYDATVANAAGKPVWITETGWPVSGPTENQAVASIANAKTYWDDVACTVLGNINTWWYTLQDAAPDTPSPSFGIVGSDLQSAPLYDLTCPAGSSGAAACGSGSSSSSSSASSSATSSVSSASAPTTTAATTTASIVSTPGEESTGSASLTTSGASSGMTSAASQSTSEAKSSMTSEASSETSEATSTGSQRTITTRITSMVTVTSCAGGCDTTTLTLSSGDTYTMPDSACSETSMMSSAATSSGTATAPATPSGSSCPANLNGEYQYPHLIVPVSKSNPDKAYGTQYNGTVSPDVSTVFNFDIPASYAGETCSLLFLLPEQAALETSAYTFNGQGGISVSELSAPATADTTYHSVPSGTEVGSVASVQEGNSYVVVSHTCAAGQRIAFEFSSTGGLDLEWFNDYNPSPLGVFITVC